MQQQIHDLRKTRDDIYCVIEYYLKYNSDSEYYVIRDTLLAITLRDRSLFIPGVGTEEIGVG